MRAFLPLLLFLAGCAAMKDEATTPVHIVWQKVDDVHATCQEISGRRELTSGRSSRTCFIATATWFSPRNGTSPVSIS